MWVRKCCTVGVSTLQQWMLTVARLQVSVSKVKEQSKLTKFQTLEASDEL